MTITSFPSFQTVYLDVVAGSFVCSNFIPCASAPASNEFDCGGAFGTDASNPTCQGGNSIA